MEPKLAIKIGTAIVFGFLMVFFWGAQCGCSSAPVEANQSNIYTISTDLPVPIPLNGIEPIPFDFGVALGHLQDGLRVVDVNWGTGEWLEITNCQSVSGNFIVKYNQGDFAVFQPDATAMLTARYFVVK